MEPGNAEPFQPKNNQLIDILPPTPLLSLEGPLSHRELFLYIHVMMSEPRQASYSIRIRDPRIHHPGITAGFVDGTAFPSRICDAPRQGTPEPISHLVRGIRDPI